MRKIENNLNKILVSLIIVLLIIFIYVLKDFLSYYSSLTETEQSVNLIGKILPPLLGAFFSGIVAISIFVLTKIKEDFTKKNNSTMYLEIIKNEIESNLKSVKQIKEFLKNDTFDNLAISLTKDASLLQKFTVLAEQLSTEIIDKFLVQLNKDDYLAIIKAYKNFNLLIDSLNLITGDKELHNSNKEIVLARLDKLFDYFDHEEMIKKITTPFYENTVIVVISISLIYLFLNIITFKFIL